MHLEIEYGQEHLELEIQEKSLVQVTRGQAAEPLAEPGESVRQSLETPRSFPALRKALTPDDHIAVVLGEELPCLPELLTPILEHVTAAHVRPEAITVVCPPTFASSEWIEQLAEAFPQVHVEVHDPADRERLAYLASTRSGRRLYLNRTTVDADQLVVLARRGFDPLLGYSGSEGALYPVLSDEPTRKEMYSRLSLRAPGNKPWPVRQEAEEVAWLLGAPFMVQIIDGPGETVSHVVSGLNEANDEALRLLNAHWRVSVDRLADVVVATVGGNRRRQTFARLAEALATASRVVKPNGRIVLLTQAEPTLGAGAELMRTAEEPGQALGLLRRNTPVDATAAFQWASAAQQARIYLLSDLPPETAEELFTVPLEHAGQVQRLVDDGRSCLFLAEAHKTLAVARRSDKS